VVCGATSVGVTESYFNWIDMTAQVYRQHAVLGTAFAVFTFIVPTLIVMIAYIKVFLVVRRQMRSMSIAVLGEFGSRSVFGSSVRSAKNLFVMPYSCSKSKEKKKIWQQGAQATVNLSPEDGIRKAQF